MDSINPIRLRIHSTNSRYANPPTSTLPPRLLAIPLCMPLSSLSRTFRICAVYFSYQNQLVSKLSISWRNVPRPLDDRIIPDSEYASAEEGEDDLQASLADTEADSLCVNAFERSFAIEWLTGFITRSERWISVWFRFRFWREIRHSWPSDQFTFRSHERRWRDRSCFKAFFSFPSTTSSTSKKEIQVEYDVPLSKEDHTSVGL